MKIAMMSTVVNFLLTISLLMTKIQGSDGLYFTQLDYSVSIASADIGTEVVRMLVHRTPSVLHPRVGGVIHMDCLVVAVHNGFVKDPKKPFHVTVDEKEATVKLIVGSTLNVRETTYRVHVRCTDKTDGVDNDTHVTVHVHHHDDNRRHHNVTETLCRRRVTFQVAENIDSVVLGTLPCANTAICPHDLTHGCRLAIRGRRTGLNDNSNDVDFADHISIEPETGRLMVEKSFDREQVNQLTMTYRCPSEGNVTSGPAT
jgi:hypothetical protein